MNENKLIADLLLPDINTSPDYYENIYPNRVLPEGAMVTRFAPSPTGFLHLGSLFAAFIYERLAHQSGGTFYLRIEDTDKKREVQGSTSEIIRGLKTYNISFDEDAGYGPHIQSQRENIYKTYVKFLLEKGLAYPCFCTLEELEELRKLQENKKVNTGYYGAWTKHRNIALKEIKQNLKEGKNYVIRLKSPGSADKRIIFNDLIKGKIEMPENVQDIVILKTDGLPTYHFAHAVDDHLMRTTHVVRGEEWLSSTPIHLQLFDVLGFERPEYAHIPTLMKMDGTSKRKLSKRKDPELAFSFYEEEGYLPSAVIEYLLHIINSNYEDWRKENPLRPYEDFKIDINKISASGAIFDLNKLTVISKDIIALMKSSDIYELYLKWCESYDTEMAAFLKADPNYCIQIFNIERNSEKPRKDIGKWSDVREDIFFFYDDLYYSKNGDYNYPKALSKGDIQKILSRYINVYCESDNKETWFNKLKAFGENLGYSPSVKNFKKNPAAYKGHIGDVAMVLRIALTKKTATPDLYEMIKVLGTERLTERLTYTNNLLNSI